MEENQVPELAALDPNSKVKLIPDKNKKKIRFNWTNPLPGTRSPTMKLSDKTNKRFPDFYLLFDGKSFAVIRDSVVTKNEAGFLLTTDRKPKKVSINPDEKNIPADCFVPSCRTFHGPKTCTYEIDLIADFHEPTVQEALKSLESKMKTGFKNLEDRVKKLEDKFRKLEKKDPECTESISGLNN